MANSKISALTSASTPLAGTETLPIVQSSTTKQVSVANLTAGRAVSATSLTANVVYTTALAASPASTTQNFYIFSSSGLNANAGIEWQYSASGSGYGFKMNVNGGTDTLDIGYRANSATWTKTFGFGNDGNLVPFVAAKGVNFTANTPAAGMTSQLLNWYEEGSWTPSIANAFNNYTHTIQVGRYTRIGNLVTLEFTVAWTTTNAGAFSFFIDGLPFTPVTLTNYVSAGAIGAINNLTNTNQIVCQVESATSQIKFYARVSGSSATALASANWNTAGTANKVSGTITYQV